MSDNPVSLPTPALPEFDRSVLAALRSWGGACATYVVRNKLDMAGAKGLRTARVLAAFKRMEKKGIVRRVPSSYAVMISWEVSPT